MCRHSLSHISFSVRPAAVDKHHCHAGDTERSSRSGGGEIKRRWRDAHDAFEQLPAEPEPTAAVHHLHQHAVSSQHRGHT